MLKAYNRINVTEPSWMVKIIGEFKYREIFKRYNPGKTLDIGCGSGEKKCVFPHDSSYVGVDHINTPHIKSNIDVFCDAYHIAFIDECFDTIFCTGVLEHLEEPQLAVREAYRVLQLGGFAIYTVPLFWHLHEQPRDFFRYTKYGLKYIFEKAGFEVIAIDALSGFWVTFGTEFNYYIQRFKKGLLRHFINAWVVLTNLLCLKLDRGFLRDERFTWMYIVIAQKPKVISRP